MYNKSAMEIIICRGDIDRLQSFIRQFETKNSQDYEEKLFFIISIVFLLIASLSQLDEISALIHWVNIF